ncbi:ATP-binding protein [Streptomyces sp. p1417]|uniref:histidine kinase n=1 Tax=Streptomyces typhae TaxID=2681492 RepID=A0A6L6X8A6_9ACTN|nr:ATP-binding protein [Streptomyces typhae]MVO90155.1 ATP-binding protein [Streptomyces typhae]
MVSVQSPPGGREVPYARVLLLPAMVMAAATGAAVAAVTEPARTAVGLCGAVATLLVVAVGAEAARRGRVLRDLRRSHAAQIAHLEHRIATHDEDTVRLGRELLPQTLYRVRQGEAPSEVIRHVIDGDENNRRLPQPQRVLLRSILDTADHEVAMRENAQRAFVNIARRVQSIVHQQSAELRDMEEFHGRNPEVFDDLLRLDHGTALIGRLADSVTVLGGARPGRQWPKPVPLFSVLRGAMSRILEYRRIELHSITDVAIHGTKVEPLIHACAELLDNATRYSPPQTKVHVTAVEVQSGVAVEIEDGGVSLSEEARKRAEKMLEDAKQGKDLTDLTETPRLGLAVVGRLSRMYNLQVSLRQSAYGGVRAVLIVPRDMITAGEAPGIAHGIGASAVPRVNPDGTFIEEARDIRRKKPRKVTTVPRPSMPVNLSMEDEIPEVTEWTAQGLPQRRSRATMSLHERYAQEAEAQRRAEAAIAAQPPAPLEPPKKEQKAPGLWVEAFMAGLNGETPPARDAAEGPAAKEQVRGQNDHTSTDNADEGGWK